jgi:HSP90 family molecular chaperone
MLLRDILDELKACGGNIEKEIGAKILDELTKAAERLPEKYQRQHAEIYRATGEV